MNFISMFLRSRKKRSTVFVYQLLGSLLVSRQDKRVCRALLFSVISVKAFLVPNNHWLCPFCPCLPVRVSSRSRRQQRFCGSLLFVFLPLGLLLLFFVLSFLFVITDYLHGSIVFSVVLCIALYFRCWRWWFCDNFPMVSHSFSFLWIDCFCFVSIQLCL